jgi:hypothetical protein
MICSLSKFIPSFYFIIFLLRTKVITFSFYQQINSIKEWHRSLCRSKSLGRRRENHQQIQPLKKNQQIQLVIHRDEMSLDNFLLLLLFVFKSKWLRNHSCTMHMKFERICRFFFYQLLIINCRLLYNSLI